MVHSADWMGSLQHAAKRRQRVDVNGFNIVLIGENFPVGSIDLEDFHFLGRPVQERVRLPMVLEAQAGEFSITVLPERFQVSVRESQPTSDKVEAVVAAAEVFLEYAGRRTITAVGHNCAIEIGADEPGQVLSPVIDHDRLKDALGLEEAPEADLTLWFKKGAESRSRLKVVAHGRKDTVLLDFNFHYTIARGEDSIDAESAISSFGASLEMARTLAESFPAMSSVRESA